MVESICDFVINIFGSQAWIAVMIIAALPIVELRGAIPIAFGLMPWWQAYIFSVIGSTLPAFVIVPLLIPFFTWLKKRKWATKLAEHFDKKFKRKSKSIKDEAGQENLKHKKDAVKFFGVLFFVAIPLPLTGAWTGSAVAAYVGLDFKKSILAVFIGNVIAGGIMTAICTIWKGYEGIILISFLALAVLVILGSLLLKLLKKFKVVEEIAVENPELLAKADGATDANENVMENTEIANVPDVEGDKLSTDKENKKTMGLEKVAVKDKVASVKRKNKK